MKLMLLNGDLREICLEPIGFFGMTTICPLVKVSGKLWKPNTEPSGEHILQEGSLGSLYHVESPEQLNAVRG